MRKINLGLILFCFFFTSGCYANNLLDSSKQQAKADNTEELKGQELDANAIIKVSETTIELEVAQTPQQQAIGLMFRESLPDNRGMLFPFESPRKATFWMKNVSIPLDMIFVSGDRIVDIAASVPPCRTEPCPLYGPDALVDKVIELRGGRSEELGLSAGDTITIEFLATP